MFYNGQERIFVMNLTKIVTDSNVIVKAVDGAETQTWTLGFETFWPGWKNLNKFEKDFVSYGIIKRLRDRIGGSKKTCADRFGIITKMVTAWNMQKITKTASQRPGMLAKDADKALSGLNVFAANSLPLMLNEALDTALLKPAFMRTLAGNCADDSLVEIIGSAKGKPTKELEQLLELLDEDPEAIQDEAESLKTEIRKHAAMKKK